jgi:hypothetical protein
VRTLRFGKHKQARVWLDELPDSRYAALHTIVRQTIAGGDSTPVRTRAAVELYVPTGPRWYYGLLGGEWYADPTENSCRVSVSIAGANTKPLTDSLAALDKVHTGLPLEFAEAVCVGLQTTLQQLAVVPRGTLAIICAAHGEIGSCDAVFQQLGAVLVKLLHASPAAPSDDELIQLFPATLG